MRNLRRLTGFLIIIFLISAATVSTDVLPGSAGGPIVTAPQSTLISVMNNFGEDPETAQNFTWETSQDMKTGFIEYCPKNEFQSFTGKNILRYPRKA